MKNKKRNRKVVIEIDWYTDKCKFYLLKLYYQLEFDGSHLEFDNIMDFYESF